MWQGNISKWVFPREVKAYGRVWSIPEEPWHFFWVEDKQRYKKAGLQRFNWSRKTHCNAKHWLPFPSLLPGDQNIEKLQQLWSEFMEIISDLKLDYKTDESIVQLEEKIKGWFKIFLSLYQAKDVTPYMHALYSHVPEFLKLYKNVAFFSQQGIEKYNDVASKNYFRSSNHREISALKQLLKKYRVQFLEAAGFERVKQSYQCSNCSS